MKNKKAQGKPEQAQNDSYRVLRPKPLDLYSLA
uniref:Uncharacterized protein n=1 Tax=Dulem virus 37 TaxID=3145755 RepID=A0AAU8AY50_9CAUD